MTLGGGAAGSVGFHIHPRIGRFAVTFGLLIVRVGFILFVALCFYFDLAVGAFFR